MAARRRRIGLIAFIILMAIKTGGGPQKRKGTIKVLKQPPVKLTAAQRAAILVAVKETLVKLQMGCGLRRFVRTCS